MLTYVFVRMETSNAANRIREAIVCAVSMLPRAAIGALLRRAVAGRRVALCFHQVRDDDEPPHPIAANASRRTDVDELLALLNSALSPEQVTVTFDDGYAAAADYVRAHAPRHPSIEWLYFVCPEKVEKGVGYRWDLHAARLQRGGGGGQRLPETPDPARENERRELAEVCGSPRFRLTTVDECRDLARLPNVRLGNHGNAHLPWSSLSLAQVARDVAASFSDFERLFGPCPHFAIPFGTPGVYFGKEHVECIRNRSDAVIWSTAGRAHVAEDRQPGALLPRFGVPGEWPYRRTAALVALQCLMHPGRAEGAALDPHPA